MVNDVHEVFPPAMCHPWKAHVYTELITSAARNISTGDEQVAPIVAQDRSTRSQTRRLHPSSSPNAATTSSADHRRYPKRGSKTSRFTIRRTFSVVTSKLLRRLFHSSLRRHLISRSTHVVQQQQVTILRLLASKKTIKERKITK